MDFLEFFAFIGYSAAVTTLLVVFAWRFYKKHQEQMGGFKDRLRNYDKNYRKGD
jgi:hypothetical protein